jgi:Holliday junction resolvase
VRGRCRGSTQSLIYLLHQLSKQGKLPDQKIYIDSPLAEKLVDWGGNVGAKVAVGVAVATVVEYVAGEMGARMSPVLSSTLELV